MYELYYVLKMISYLAKDPTDNTSNSQWNQGDQNLVPPYEDTDWTFFSWSISTTRITEIAVAVGRSSLHNREVYRYIAF